MLFQVTLHIFVLDCTTSFLDFQVAAYISGKAWLEIHYFI